MEFRGFCSFRRAVRLAWTAVFALPLGLSLSCSSGGGGGGGIFKIISINVDEGAVWEINRPIEFLFDDQVNINSVSLTTISIHALAPTVIGSGTTAPTVAPVIGQFSIKPYAADHALYNRVVVFQPACPPAVLPTGEANIANTGGALEPSTSTVTFNYRIDVLSSNQTSGPVVKSLSEKSLNLGVTRNFTTQQASAPFVDTLATPLAASGAVTNFPEGGEVESNHFTDPVVFVVTLDQAVLPSSFIAATVLGSFQLLYDTTPGNPTPTFTGLVPATYALSNCNLNGSTTVTITPLGILPADRRVRILMDNELKDVGGQANSDDVVIATAQVSDKVASTQIDMLLEDFDDATHFDSTNADYFFPPAVWKDGYLQAAEPLPGLDVLPGVNITVSSIVEVDTTQTILTGVSTVDGSTVNVNVVDGVIKVNKLTVESGGQLIGFGPNPLTILAANPAPGIGVEVKAGGLISVRGGDSPTANMSSFSLTLANLPDPGGAGRAGGGDGGAASPSTADSDARGGHGSGAGNAPGAGGKGGNAGIGSVSPFPRGAGGGGGTWNHSGAEPNYNCPTTTATTDCDCVQTTSNPAGTGVPTLGRGTNLNGLPGRNGTAFDVFGGVPAAGGVAGGGVFADGVTTNNFSGIGATGSSAPFTVLRGELDGFVGGAGGGAGGDAIPSSSPSLPAPSTWDFTNLNKKGGSGGGGGGVLVIRALGSVVIDGEIDADGGTGGGGQPTDLLDRVGGGGGGGAGGSIIIMSAYSVTVGSAPIGSNHPKIHAWGGDPGAGNRVQVTAGGNCYQGGNTRQNTPTLNSAPDAVPATQNYATSIGGPGGRGLIQIHVPRQNTGAFDTSTTPNVLVIDGSSLPINGSSPNQLATIPNTLTIHPPPFILAPDFGKSSVARSTFYYTGLANVDDTDKPDYYFLHDGSASGTTPYASIGSSFPATTTTVSLTAGTTQSLASGTSGALTVLGANSVLIASATLYSAVASNPAMLAKDLLTIGSTGYTIASASLPATNSVILHTEPTSGTISSSGSWSVARRYFSIDTPGSTQQLPAGSTIDVNFEVRDEASSSNPGTPATSYTSGDPEKYLRYSATFTIGGTLSPQSPRPRLGFMKVLLDY